MSWITQDDFNAKCQNALGELTTGGDVGAEQLAFFINNAIAQEGAENPWLVVAWQSGAIGMFGSCMGPWMWSGTANGSTYQVAVFWR